MIGILIVTHGGLAAELSTAAVAMTSDSERMAAVGLQWDEDPGSATERIREGLAAVDDGQGVLILTDMFGGTPANLVLPFLHEERVEIITGVNLPMLLRSLTGRREESLASLARAACERGRKSIEVASNLLAATPRAER